MTKTQARKRLAESRNKIVAVVIQGSTHLTPSEANKLWKMNGELMKLVMKLK
jgi:hypothetical protein